jgi:hypothetical protein
MSRLLKPTLGATFQSFYKLLGEYHFETKHQQQLIKYLLDISCDTKRYSHFKEFYSFYDDTDGKARNEYFIKAYQSNNLDLVKWLYNFGDINIHDNNEYIFRWCCIQGYLDIAQWIYSLGNVNLFACDSEAFEASCTNGHIHVIKWLYSLGKYKLDVQYLSSLFDQACRDAQIEVAGWLYLVGANIHLSKDRYFIELCQEDTISDKHFRVLKFMYNLDKKYYDDFVRSTFSNFSLFSTFFGLKVTNAPTIKDPKILTLFTKKDDPPNRDNKDLYLHPTNSLKRRHYERDVNEPTNQKSVKRVRFSN